MNRQPTETVRRRVWRSTASAIALLALTAVSAGCSSDGSSQSKGGGDEELSLIFVGHGPETDPTAGMMIKGFKDFCDEKGWSCKYRGPKSSSFSAAAQAAALDAALAESPDGMLVTDPAPEGLNATIKSIVDGGTPVALVNQATEADVEATGALQAVAADPFTTGKLTGEAMAAAGVKHPLVLSVTPGIPFVDQRVAGFLEAFPKDAVNVLQLPVDTVNNPTAVVQGASAALAKDKDVDGVFSIGNLFNAPMLAVKDKLGNEGAAMKWATIDLGDATIKGLENGDLIFAADEQPYLQGYLGAQAIYLGIQGLDAGQPFLRSGPSLVTPDAIEDYKVAVEAGVRG